MKREEIRFSTIHYQGHQKPIDPQESARINLPMAGQMKETKNKQIIIMVVAPSLNLFGSPMTLIPTPLHFFVVYCSGRRCWLF